jgi:hypothetical protein
MFKKKSTKEASPKKSIFEAFGLKQPEPIIKSKIAFSSDPIGLDMQDSDMIDETIKEAPFQ